MHMHLHLHMRKHVCFLGSQRPHQEGEKPSRIIYSKSWRALERAKNALNEGGGSHMTRHNGHTTPICAAVTMR